ncbi:nitroreductase [Brevibacillus fortis]|uniref:Putative NAD(P)H nitroreductase n=1 Tax=Brevibacillus fortis TaxID=2126352 RepID=A0A2P7V2I9_9BACL|nr:nitroreductase [Brevibacillus fortis]MED1782048.1 nitroreductase [Brevibacillus fortis]PSJ93449.1 nitroreductase [Brevibacillus fortis]
MMSPQYPIAQAIRDRRTIKKFKPDPVPLELIRELLDVAVWAPNHGLREPWRFVLYREEGKQIVVDAILQNAMKKRDPELLLRVPAYLFVIVNEDSRQREREEDYAAACTLIQNFQLAAWERGLGVVWKTEPFTYQAGFLQAVGVRAEEKLVGMLQLGFPEVIPEARARTAANDKLTVIDSTVALEDKKGNVTVTADH